MMNPGCKINKAALRRKRIRLSDLSIRTIFLLSLLSITILSITSFYLITINSVSDNLDKIEYAELEIHSDVIHEDFAALNAAMFHIATDYGVWNEAYQMAEAGDKAYFKRDYTEWLSENLNLDLILVLDSKKNTLASYGIQPEVIMADQWMGLVIKNNLYSRYELIAEPYKSGLIRLGDNLYAIGASPIVRQDLTQAPAGVVMVGKQLDLKYMEDLSDKYQYKISIRLDNETSFGELPKDNIDQYFRKGSLPTKRIGDYSIVASVLNNSLNEKIGDLVIGSSYNKYSQLYSSINKYIGFGSIIVLAVVIIFSLLLSRVIISPLTKMEKKINQMMESGQPEPLDDIASTSEINTVTEAFNSLIETIHAREEDIETKDRFIALISHEFKTPITIINAAIQAMNTICKDDMTPKISSYLDKINRNSLRQLRLVDNLLDITRIKAGQIKVSEKRIDIAAHTKEIVDSVRIFALQKNISLNCTTAPDKIVMHIDEQKYERILFNLISNGIKFSPSGGSIDINLTAGDELLKLEVIDTGIGIPAEKQDLIFEKFGQVDSSLSRQAEGTGIGLYLVKSFVTILGGTITLISREGKGSNFTIYLPLKTGELQIGDEIPAGDKVDQAASLEFSDILF